jgi:hypothetical protein
MKRLLAWSMVIALMNVIALCPLLAAGTPPQTSSCCHHSRGQSVPCTESTGGNCPYVLLEKAKSERGLSTVELAAIPVSVGAEFHPEDWSSAPVVPHYFKDASGSYLLHRVLRI